MEEDYNSEISIKKGSKEIDISRREPANGRLGQMVRSRVHVLVVEADSLRSSDRHSLGIDPYCKLNIGREKAKTKIIERSNCPVWKESVSILWTEGYSKLNLQIHDWKATGHCLSQMSNVLSLPEGRNDCLGRVELDLSELSWGVSHDLWRWLEGGEGSLHFIVTITDSDQARTPGEEELLHHYVSVHSECASL